MVKQSEDSIDRFIQDRDNLLMKIVLKYFSVLVAEKKSHIARVAEEFDASDRKRHHILIDRDFQVSSTVDMIRYDLLCSLCSCCRLLQRR